MSSVAENIIQSKALYLQWICWLPILCTSWLPILFEVDVQRYETLREIKEDKGTCKDVSSSQFIDLEQTQ